MLTVGGIPAHPLVIHAVVVLLPLAAVGTLLVVARPVWRQQLDVWVLILAVIGVAAVPVATTTGEQLRTAIGGGGELVDIHEHRADTLLVPALIFLVLLAATVIVGRRTQAAIRTGGPGAAHAVVANTGTLQRVTLVTGILAAVAGLVVAGLVVWIGDAGATAAWSGVGG